MTQQEEMKNDAIYEEERERRAGITDKIEIKREDLYKSWGYDTDKLPFGTHMWLEPEKGSRQNPYSGVIVELNPVEMAIYDHTMMAYHDHIELGTGGDLVEARKMYKDFTKGKNWFIENNVQAYMDLID
jgi:hypothetical protein